VASWIEPLGAALALAPAFRARALRPARRDDEEFLFALHRAAMREYVEATWGWDEHWQRTHFARAYKPGRHAVVVRTGPAPADIGRISLTRHWRRIFLRDVELIAAERNRGLGSALIRAVLALARAEGRGVELLVLKCNPAQRLYARLGFEIVADDGERLTMRAESAGADGGL
jgi:GNAT superfamily N-acetyltransferase